MRNMPYVQPPEIERILDTQVAKRTRQKEYLQYLVKWKNCPIEDSLWLDARQIEQMGSLVEKIMDRSHDFFFPWEPDASYTILCQNHISNSLWYSHQYTYKPSTPLVYLSNIWS